MKSYTDIKQSKKLTEILPVESADMWWSKNFIYYNPTAAIGISAEYSNVYTYKFGEDDIPCWSLAALLDQLEDVIVDENGYNYQLQIIKEGVQYYLVYDGMDYAAYYDTSLFDNLVDACVEMILKLHEQKII